MHTKWSDEEMKKDKTMRLTTETCTKEKTNKKTPDSKQTTADAQTQGNKRISKAT